MPSSPDTRTAGRPRATLAGALVEGWRRALRAPWLTGGVLIITVLLALPLAMTLGTMLEAHLGSSRESDRAAAGWNASWAGEFAAGTQGVGRTFTHEIIGFGGTIAIVSRFLDHEPLNPAVSGVVAAYVVVWVFLSGGILDRLARDRPVGTGAFFSAGGVYFVRFVRLGIVVGFAYWALFTWLHPYLLTTLYDRWTRDMTVERHALALRAGLYAVWLLALAAVSLVADFAKVRTVVEDRRSMIGAIGASIRFIRRRPGRSVALYLLNAMALLVIVAAWSLAAPSAAASPWAALLLAQVYLLFRVWARLAFLGSEVAFFQGALAHAHYTAGPLPIWPDSPAAEALENLAVLRRTTDGRRHK
jgi:hypothetical protein